MAMTLEFRLPCTDKIRVARLTLANAGADVAGRHRRRGWRVGRKLADADYCPAKSRAARSKSGGQTATTAAVFCAWRYDVACA
jgi:hypothetical protein